MSVSDPTTTTTTSTKTVSSVETEVDKVVNNLLGGLLNNGTVMKALSVASIVCGAIFHKQLGAEVSSVLIGSGGFLTGVIHWVEKKL